MTLTISKDFYPGSNGTSQIERVLVYPEGAPKGIVYFAHGVTEYAERHMTTIHEIAAAGYIVVANSHMGHGESTSDARMYFTGRHNRCGWDCAVEDAETSLFSVRAEYPGLPVYGIGFSLGSFIVRHMAIQYPKLFKAIVLLGTGYQGKLAIKLGQMMAKSEGKKYGMTKGTAKIDGLTFGTYNKKFEKDTHVDWLCASDAARKAYLNDKRIGMGFTAGLFYDLLWGMEYTCDSSNISQMNKDCQILMISGGQDAVGDFGKGVAKLEKLYNKHGLKVQKIIYDDARHDLLNEHCAQLVRQDIINFFASV